MPARKRSSGSLPPDVTTAISFFGDPVIVDLLRFCLEHPEKAYGTSLQTELECSPASIWRKIAALEADGIITRGFDWVDSNTYVKPINVNRQRVSELITALEAYILDTGLN